ncbi:hypothetical protein V5S96_03050 [Corynebacterium mastitidis]|uniref:Uncharacterized protein n=1 Tax=Corynebacterium mastitidis TaxID=161890 RepID=A0ABU8NWE2_9CORY
MAQERFAGPEHYAAFDPKKWMEQIRQNGKAEDRPQRQEEERDAADS